MSTIRRKMLNYVLIRRSASAASNQTLPVSGSLYAWHDLSDLSTLYQDAAATSPVVTDADPIGYMADKSGGGRNAILTGTSGSRPIYTANYRNGRGAALFDGSRYLDSTAMFTNSPLTVLIAGVRYTTVSNTQGLWSSRDSGTGGIRVGFNTSNQVSASSATPASSKASVATFGVGTPFIAGVTVNTSNIQAIANTEVGSASSTYGGSSNFFGWGRLNTNNTSSLAFMYMLEGMVYNAVLSPTDLTTMIEYLNTKWSIY